jgi:hypothetical protein
MRSRSTPCCNSITLRQSDALEFTLGLSGGALPDYILIVPRLTLDELLRGARSRRAPSSCHPRTCNRSHARRTASCACTSTAAQRWSAGWR